jgi:hypothetical protein
MPAVSRLLLLRLRLQEEAPNFRVLGNSGDPLGQREYDRHRSTQDEAKDGTSDDVNLEHLYAFRARC